MTYTTPAHQREADYDAMVIRLTDEGRKAREEGKGIHENPYDYQWEPVAADYWDRGYKGGAA